MALTPQEVIAVMKDLLKATEVPGGVAAFEAAFDELGLERDGVSLFAAYAAAASSRGALLNETARVAAALNEAARVAATRGFHAQLKARIQELLPATVSPQGTEVVSEGPTEVGTHQGVVRPGALMERRWVSVLERTFPCVGAVIDAGRNRKGTAFLIDRDRVLTAAHVVWPFVDSAGPQPQPLNDTEFWIEFSDDKAPDPKHALRVVRATGSWLIASSPPCGTPPNFSISEVSKAGENLDFAVVQVDEPIGDELSYLDVASTPPATGSATLAICGYQGGNALSFSIDLLKSHDVGIGRLRHQVSTGEGMSGSPCLTVDGRVIGVHEGEVKDAGGNFLYNRSVYLGRIHEFLKGAGLTEWYKAGGATRWLPESMSIEPLKALGTLPFATTIPWRRHPTIGRDAFQQWIKDAATPDAHRRIALVGGADGAGKTFSLQLLGAQLRRETDVLCVITPEVARAATAQDVFTRLNKAAMIDDRDGGRTSPGALRPDAGLLRHDVVPNGLDRLQRALTDPYTGKIARRVWLAIDFGRGDAAWLPAAEIWKEILTQAAPRRWMRLVIIGTEPTRFAADLRSMMIQEDEPPFEEEVKHADEQAILDFLDIDIGGRLNSQQRQDIRERLRQTLRRIAQDHRPELYTTAAMYCLLTAKSETVRRGTT